MSPEKMLLIGELLAGRRRAAAAALAEAQAVCEPLGARLLTGGPLSERGGLYWLEVPAGQEEALAARTGWLGYTRALYAARPTRRTSPSRPAEAADLEGTVVRWRGEWYELEEVFAHAGDDVRELAPDRRRFLFEDRHGQIREVVGYRGSRRGLPITDARLTLNLSGAVPGARLLEPFAGAGAIVLEAVARRIETHSTDIDPQVRHGLAALGSRHVVADARRLPYPDAAFDAIAGEPPYLPEVTTDVADAVPELARVLRTGGRICLFAAAHQSDPLREAAGTSGLVGEGVLPVDRKGTPCVALVFRRAATCPNPPSQHGTLEQILSSAGND